MKHCLATLAAPLLAFGTSSARLQSSDSPSSKSVNNRTALYGELANAPGKARERRNPFENDPEAVAAGRNLFEQHCAQCHAEVQEAPPGAIFWILTNGVVRRGMPVWSKLPEPQRWQLVSYIKSLSVPVANESLPLQRECGVTAQSSLLR